MNGATVGTAMVDAGDEGGGTLATEANNGSVETAVAHVIVDWLNGGLLVIDGAPPEVLCKDVKEKLGGVVAMVVCVRSGRGKVGNG